MVEHTTHNLKIKGLNPAAGTGREINGKKYRSLYPSTLKIFNDKFKQIVEFNL